MLSCSTCWNSARHTDGEAMVMELADLGFSQVELSHGIRISLVEGIQRAADKGRIQFSSLHNFCPLPAEVTRPSPDCYQFSSPDPAERQRAVRLSFQTIDYAVRLGVPRIVLHLGRTPRAISSEPLLQLASEGRIHSRLYVKTKLRLVQERARAAAKPLAHARECLLQVAEYAEKKRVTLGIESRHKYEEIPCESEMLALLDEFPGPTVGYWHDFGHVQVKHNLGFLNHLQWLQKTAQKLVGCHLHDTAWPGKDHLPPFSGDIDYPALLQLLPNSTLFVFEIHPKRDAKELSEAREKWTQLFGP